MSKAYRIWELRKGDTLIAVLNEYNFDFPWAICHFEPTSAYETYRSLFESEPRIEQATEAELEEWEGWQARVMNLGMILVARQTGYWAKDFILHIYDKEVHFRADLLDPES